MFVPLSPPIGEVMADVYLEDGTKIRMRSTLDTDGKKAWKKIVHGNELSFDDMHKRNLESALDKVFAKREADVVAVRLGIHAKAGARVQAEEL